MIAQARRTAQTSPKISSKTSSKMRTTASQLRLDKEGWAR